MPTIAKFYGIVILMHPRGKEHNPPHLHAYYGVYKASVALHNAKIFQGNLPPKAEQLVIEFTLKHQTELLTMWETQNFTKLPPLE